MKRIITAMMILASMQAVSARTQYVYNQSTGNYETIQVRVDSDGRVRGYNLDTGETIRGSTNPYQGRSNVYDTYSGNYYRIDTDEVEDY